MSLQLTEPVKKKFSGPISFFTGKPPLPITCISNEEDIIHEDLWIIYTGRYNGINIIVDDSEEVKSLYTMGFFGKGCLSKKFPSFDDVKGGVPRIIRERQWQRRRKWSKEIENKLSGEKKNEAAKDEEPAAKKRAMDSSSEPASTSEGVVFVGKENLSLSGEVVVIPDSEGEDDDYLSRLNPRLEVDSPQTVFESLHLTLEEAFFLCYGLGCLQVIDLLGNLLSIPTLWNIFRQSQTDFVERYVAYHYFRSKGWVVKPGMKFGGHFILYKKGPAFYHSSYIVVIETYDSKGKRETNNSAFRYTTLNRLGEAAFKEVLICEIMRPDVEESDMAHPSVLPKFKVRENLLRRWQPTENREEDS